MIHHGLVSNDNGLAIRRDPSSNAMSAYDPKLKSACLFCCGAQNRRALTATVSG